MATRLLPLPLILLVVLGSPVLTLSDPAPPQPSQSPPGWAQSEEMRRGVEHFERAFYVLTPQKRDAEAAGDYELAMAEFERELRARPSSTEAHRYLARIRSVRKEFRKAAEHYDAIAAINPADIDACVLAALAYVEDGDLTAARVRLNAARSRTTDPRTLSRLAEYLTKLDAARP